VTDYTANILFCFYNEQYWLYAIECYGYNLYFLFMVGYVCRAYVLKTRSGRLDFSLGPSFAKRTEEARNREKAIFYSIFITLIVLYTAIFIASMIKEINSERDEDSSRKVRYCECNRSNIQKLSTFVLTYCAPSSV
jgi:hypothetical protein